MSCIRRLVVPPMVLTVLVIAGCGRDGPSAAPDGPVGGGRIDVETLDATMAGAGISTTGPGCAAAVGTDDGVVWAAGRGLADLEDGTAIDATTVFDIASTSKQFTATALLLLEADGRLRRHDRLSDWVPGLPDWSTRVTLDQLMHHTSGIPDYVELLADRGVLDHDPASTADALAVIAAVDEPESVPGRDFAYSNSNYVLLAEVVEAASGSDLGSYVDQEVFSPLGLDAVLDPEARPPGRATAYADRGTGYEEEGSAWTQVGDGAVQTSPTELVTWAAEYWRPTLGGPELLSARLEGAVADPETGGSYGAGIEVYEEGGDLVLSHSGEWAGFVTDLVVLPAERVAAAVSCNTAEIVDPTALAEALLDA